MAFRVECGIEYYRIIGPNGEEGPRVPWEAVACLQIDNELYYCIGDPDADEQTVERVIKSHPQETAYEDVRFDDEEGDDEEVEEVIEEGDEEEDDEEEEEVGPRLV